MIFNLTFYIVFLCYSSSSGTFSLSPWGNSVSVGFNMRFTNNRKTINHINKTTKYYIILTPMYDLSNRLYFHFH